MGAYEDTSWADLRVLTRRRRAEAQARMLQSRAAHEALRFPVTPPAIQDQMEAAWREREAPTVARAPHQVWKAEQWDAGHHTCGYCGVRMTRTPNVPRTCTVDHRWPRALGGADEAWNWLLACLACNGAKGTMTEAEFRALRAA